MVNESDGVFWYWRHFSAFGYGTWSIHCELFPEEEPAELEQTYYQGFKLGNSFREFDRMRGIYIDGHIEWKVRNLFKRSFYFAGGRNDQPGHLAHNIAAGILKEYGEIASAICDELYQKNPEKFEKQTLLRYLNWRKCIPGLVSDGWFYR